MSLTTGKRVIRNKWMVLPMPAEVIATVHQLGAACKKYKGIVFMDKNGNMINDDDDNNDDNTLEITGVDKTNNKNDNMNTEMDITNNNNNTLEITGVYNNTEETETTIESQNDNNEPYIAPHTHTNNEQDDTGHNQDGIHNNTTTRYLLKTNHPKICT